MSAGYSGTPLCRKLGIREGHRVAILQPGGRVEIAEIPIGASDVEVRHDLRGTKPFDVMVCFVTTGSGLAKAFERSIPRLTTAGGLWIAWPKKSSRLASRISGGISDGIVRATGLETGLVDNKVCAIDEDWSGLRFVRRLKDR